MTEQEMNVTPDQTQKPDIEKIVENIEDQEPTRKRSNRGFAGMDSRRQREIASEGGRAAHAQGKAHEFTPEEAREAGRKGGQASGFARSRQRRPGQQEETIADGERGPDIRDETAAADDREPHQSAEEQKSI